MSVRLLTLRLAKHGRQFLQNYWKRNIHTNIFEQPQNRTRSRFSAPAGTVRSKAQPCIVAKNAVNATLSGRGNSITSPSSTSGIFRFGQHARKLFIDNILSRVPNSFSENLRTQATRKLFYGDSAPFFALVGVSLASGAGMLTKEDELEGVCFEIREAAGRLQALWSHDDLSDTLDSNFSVDNLDIGPALAKGCAAVVYAASMKNEDNTSNASTSVSEMDTGPGVAKLPQTPRTSLKQQQLPSEMITPIQNMSRFVHNFGGSVDNLSRYNQSSIAASAILEDYKAREALQQENRDRGDNANKDAAMSLASIGNAKNQLERLNSSEASINRYPLALKMMFNYDIQSNAHAILRAMYKETVPARQRYMNECAEEWERILQDQTLTLPPHPNIVCMLGFFCDEVRSFPDGHLLYPVAQPQRINPHGYGRNMSLFLLMKRYDYSLRELLDSHELSMRTKLLLFTQLLEAVTHINRYGIAHRDLKTDNILIEMNDDNSPPVLVVSDFGCCLASKEHDLQLPYTSYDIDKGGNAALMAPEIINKQPGPFSVLNYGKADLWACGAIAYEIFGMHNPFYLCSGDIKDTFTLRSSDYTVDELPQLSDDCPMLVKSLVNNILNPNPSKRVSPDVAANVMQLMLWAPTNWLKIDCMPKSPEILQWLLSLSTKLMSEGRASTSESISELNYNKNGRRTYVEYLLISSFLSRAQLRRIRGALNWIHSVL